MKNLIGFFPLGMDISQHGKLSYESPVTHNTPVSALKGSFTMVKVYPVTAPIIECLQAHFVLMMSVCSLYPFTLITYNTEHPRLSVTYTKTSRVKENHTALHIFMCKLRR